MADTILCDVNIDARSSIKAQPSLPVLSIMNNKK